MPRAIAIGAVLMAVAGVVDVIVHVVTADEHHHAVALVHGAHLLGFAGMVLVLVGVAAFGIRRSTGRHAGPSEEAPHDAHR